MGFININSQSVHTSTISPVFGTSSSTITTISGNGTTGSYKMYGNNILLPKTTYHVLGQDIQVEGFANVELGIAMSTLNILGKPFYDQLKKNNVSFPIEIEEFLEKEFKALERNSKIEYIIENKSE
jgi:hypothetical protein